MKNLLSNIRRAVWMIALLTVASSALAVNQSDTLQEKMKIAWKAPSMMEAQDKTFFDHSAVDTTAKKKERMKVLYVTFIDKIPFIIPWEKKVVWVAKLRTEVFIPFHPDYNYWNEIRQGDATDEISEIYIVDGETYFDIAWLGPHPADAKDAIKAGFDHAVEKFIISNSGNPAKVKISSTGLGNGVLAVTAVDWIITGPNPQYGIPNTWYPAFLLETLFSGNANGTSFDLEISWNWTMYGSGQWSLLTNGTYVSGTYNLMYVIMHEIATGMGFQSSARYNETMGEYQLGWNGYPNIFDWSLRDGAGNVVWGNPNYQSSSQLQVLFESGQVYFLTYKLYAEDPFINGTSISRLDELYGGSNELMTAFYTVEDTIHLDIGWVAKYIMVTLGWTLETTLPNDPTAGFTVSSQTGCEGDVISFTDQSSSDVVEWEWIFEGGTPDTVRYVTQNVDVTYNTAGTYDVQLIAHSCEGSDTLVMNDYITVNSYPAPIANFHASDTCILEGESINFFDDSQNSPTSWEWTFWGGNPGTSTLQNPTGILYDTHGTYDVKLVAINQGGSDTLTKTAYIFVDSLSVLAVVPHEIDLGSEQGGISFSESFDITNDGGDTLIGTVSENADWITSLSPDNFSLTTGTSETVNFSGEFPATVGIFETYIQVSSNAGNDSVWVHGETLQPPTLCLSPLNVDLGSYPIGHTFSEDLIVENCGQGNLIGNLYSNSSIPTINPTAFNLPGGGQTIINVSGTFPNAFGSFEFYVVASSNGGDDSTHFYGTVDSLLANFTASSTLIQVGSSVNFTDLSTGNPNFWAWSFPGGNPDTSNSQNPNGILYSQIGVFDVQLVASDNYGHSDTMLKVDYITVTFAPPPPVPNFISDKDTVDASGTVYSTDLSTGDPTSWEWTFEEGTPETSSSQTPPGIVYETVGTFDVTLTVGNANGDSTLVKYDYITVIPVADAGVNDSMDEGSVYVLNGTNSFPQPLGYAWESLDGMTLDDPTSATPSFTAPMVGGDMDVQFVLTVNRDEQFSRPDTVIIKILDYVGISDSHPSGYESFEIKIYPNPFKEKLTISFSLSKSEKIVLSIFDLQGWLIATLVDQTLPAGDHLFSFKKENLTSGVYIINLYKSGAFYRKKILSSEY